MTRDEMSQAAADLLNATATIVFDVFVFVTVANLVIKLLLWVL